MALTIVHMASLIQEIFTQSISYRLLNNLQLHPLSS